MQVSRYVLNKLWILATVLVLSVCLSEITSDLTSSSHTTVSEYKSGSVDSMKYEASVFSVSTATTFEHHRQAANWVMLEIKEWFAEPLSSNYLSTEPIQEPWYTIFSGRRYRLSSWKDSNLQYKFINAFY